MKIRHVLISFFGLIILAVFIFYFWARHPKLLINNYTSIDIFQELHPEQKDTFSVMTYNIGYLSGMTNNLAIERKEVEFSKNLNNAIHIVWELDPQIIAFQEIDFNSARSFKINHYEKLAQSCGFYNGAMAINWDKSYVPFPYWPIKYHFGEMLSGQAILSDFKIISNERIVLPRPKTNTFYYDDFYLDRLAQVSWVDNHGDSLLIINVHFEAWDAATRELQSEIVIDIYKQFEDDYPIILLGDFNCSPPYSKDPFMEETISQILAVPSILSAISKEKYLSSEDKYFTFDSESPYQKIDYIFYNGLFLKCIEANVIHEAESISDHLPMFARFVPCDNR